MFGDQPAIELGTSTLIRFFLKIVLIAFGRIREVLVAVNRLNVLKRTIDRMKEVPAGRTAMDVQAANLFDAAT